MIACIVERHWSPEQIAASLQYKYSHWAISYATIYRGIYFDNLGMPLKSHDARGIARQLRHWGKKCKGKGTVNE